MIFIGVDPGLTTGIALLDTEERTATLVQSSPDAVFTIVNALIERCGDAGNESVSALAIERFVSGPRSGKLATPKGARQTRTLIEQLTMLVGTYGIRTYLRSAAEVKPWATDARVRKLTDHRGMPHALDALRHALFCAVKDFRAPDPLARGGGTSRDRSSRVGREVGGGSRPMLTAPLGDAPPPPTDG
jgi:hypothetical protein